MNSVYPYYGETIVYQGLDHDLGRKDRTNRYITSKPSLGDTTMPMLPLSFTLAAGVAFLLIQEIMVADSNNKNSYLLGFFGLLIFQFILIGLRFGYGWEGLTVIQPFSAALIAPLAYLAFLNPGRELGGLWKKLAILLLPFGAVVVVSFLARDFVDLVLGAFSFAYAALLIALGVKDYESPGLG